ncbi:MAG: M23 family metallopeptidase [Clostridia bacterium]|nr:M23 family metallopeptidase [Clostridia bacterium]
MNQNQKNLQRNRILAIALALLVVVAITVTVVAIVSSKRTKPPKDDETTAVTTTEQTTRPKPEETTAPKEENPVVAEDVTFVSPVTSGTVIKEWSADVPVFSSTMEDYRVHLGIDVEADAGTPVYAVADGTVTSVEFHPMMGQTVIITHAGGYRSVYQNLQTKIPDAIKEGAAVKAGDEIGALGDTALIEISEAPHLHFELYKDDICENPLAHFNIAPINQQNHFED